jgi:hypothetical protein
MSDLAFVIQQDMIRAGLDPLSATHAMAYVRANYWRYGYSSCEIEGIILEEIAKFQIHLEGI